MKNTLKKQRKRTGKSHSPRFDELHSDSSSRFPVYPDVEETLTKSNHDPFAGGVANVNDFPILDEPSTTMQSDKNLRPDCFGTLFDHETQECWDCDLQQECGGKMPKTASEEQHIAELEADPTTELGEGSGPELQNGSVTQLEQEIGIEPKEVATPRLPYHEYADIFPMNPEDLKALVEDIQKNGLLEPITIHEGKIVDGRNRYEACLELGIEPTFATWDQRGDLLDFVFSRNLHRRHLTESQRAMVAAKLKPLFEAAAKEHQGERTDLKPAPPSSDDQESTGNIVANLLRSGSRRSVDAAAKVLSVSPRSVQSATTVLQNGTPELVETVEAGEMKVSAGEKIAKLPREEQREAMEESRKKSRKTSREDKAGTYLKTYLAYKKAIEEARSNRWRDVTQDEVSRHLGILNSLLDDHAESLAA